MFALQSAPPSLGQPVAALLGLLAAGALLGAAGSALARRLSSPVRNYRLLYVGVFLPFAVLGYLLLDLLALGPAVVGRLVPGVGGLPAAVLADFLTLLAAGTTWLAAYAPTVRGLGAVRDVDLPTGRALARMARYVVGVCAVATVALVPFRLDPSSGWPVVAGLAGLGALFLVASPWLVSLLRPTAVPGEATADRLATLRDRAGLDVRDGRVIDTADEETADALVRGPPGYRRLFVTSTFLEAFDDDVAAALLAVQAGRVRARVPLRRVGAVVVAAGPLVIALSGDGPRGPLVAAAAAALVGGFWLVRRGVRAADDHAARRVGNRRLADALERYAGVHAIEPSRRRIPNPLSARVALGDRIDRLRERSED